MINTEIIPIGMQHTFVTSEVYNLNHVPFNTVVSNSTRCTLWRISSQYTCCLYTTSLSYMLPAGVARLPDWNIHSIVVFWTWICNILTTLWHSSSGNTHVYCLMKTAKEHSKHYETISSIFTFCSLRFCCLAAFLFSTFVMLFHATWHVVHHEKSPGTACISNACSINTI